MSVALNLAASLALASTGWFAARAVAGAPRSPRAPLLWLDAVIPLITWSLFVAATSRPLFAGALTALLGFGWAHSDRAKRRLLAEPVVYTDVFQSFDIFRHPRLALPFPHPWRIVAVALVAIALAVAAFRADPSAWSFSSWPLLAVVAMWIVLGKLVAGPWNASIAEQLRRAFVTGDAERDGRYAGPFAVLLGYGIVARAERESRRLRASVPKTPAARDGRAEPVVVVQCESFFDARRLHPALATLPLPNLDRVRKQGATWGQLEVPSWGANTVRTEFSVLSGLDPAQLGLDAFNPYFAFARAPVVSLAWRLKSLGYRTVCVHPFDPRFYGRDRVLPNLGFDAFLGEEAFAGCMRINGYVADVEVARTISALVRESAEPLFVFAITMENHGPWPPRDPLASLLPAELALPAAERDAFDSYLRSLCNADLLLGELATLQQSCGGVLAFYGDHLPSFPASFETLAVRDNRSDYLIWRPGTQGSPQDLAAHRLGEVILETRRTLSVVHGGPPQRLIA